MTEFRTEINIAKAPFSIGHESKLALMGSCFSENIGAKLKDGKFSVYINPFGILYNPLSVSNAILRVLDGFLYDQNDLVEHAGLWHSMEHHGRYSDPDKSTALARINRDITNGNEFYNQADYLFITLGTAFVYVYKKTGAPVGNCHKIPAVEFEKRLLSVEEILNTIQPVIGRLKKQNPNLKLVFTLSPVRHWKDGAVDNLRSKSILNVAMHALIAENDNCYYFPAYELMMDDLRDYRFYKEDMLHATAQAVDYIWQKFSLTYFNGSTVSLLKQVDKFKRAIEHRPFNPGSKEYQHFLNDQIKEMDKLEKAHPILNFEQERNSLASRLM